jgi:hypothetical protein
MLDTSRIYYLEIKAAAVAAEIISGLPIIKESLNITEVYHNDLKPADGSARLTIQWSQAVADFLKKYRSDTLTGRIYSPTGGLNDAFHGYIDGTYTLTKTQRLQPIAIEIISPSMDLKRSIGKRILYENYTIASILINLLLSAGVYLDNILYFL